LWHKNFLSFWFSIWVFRLRDDWLPIQVILPSVWIRFRKLLKLMSSAFWYGCSAKRKKYIVMSVVIWMGYYLTERNQLWSYGQFRFVHALFHRNAIVLSSAQIQLSTELPAALEESLTCYQTALINSCFAAFSASQLVLHTYPHYVSSQFRLSFCEFHYFL
jgi:hypothetical protein